MDAKDLQQYVVAQISRIGWTILFILVLYMGTGFFFSFSFCVFFPPSYSIRISLLEYLEFSPFTYPFFFFYLIDYTNYSNDADRAAQHLFTIDTQQIFKFSSISTKVNSGNT